MSNLRLRHGFSAVEVVIVVAIVGLIAGAGYLVYSRQSDDKAADTNTSQSTEEVPEIKSAEDLDTATQTVDETDVDTLDADLQELDSELADI